MDPFESDELQRFKVVTVERHAAALAKERKYSRGEGFAVGLILGTSLGALILWLLYEHIANPF